MLPFWSLDPFRPLREPDRRRRDEERLSRSEQRTANKPKDHLTGKAPYRFESASLQQTVWSLAGIRLSPSRSRAFPPVLRAGAGSAVGRDGHDVLRRGGSWSSSIAHLPS